MLGEYVEHLKTLQKLITRLAPTKPLRPQQLALMMGCHKRLGRRSIVRRLPKDVVKMIIGYLVEPVTTGLYIGEMKNDKRKISEACDIILGTYKLASVGMDIPALNTLGKNYELKSWLFNSTSC